MKSSLSLMATTLATVFLAACGGDDSVVDGTSDIGGDQSELDVITGDSEGDSNTSRPDTGSDTSANRRFAIILAEDPDIPIDTLINNSVSFSATVVDYWAGTPADGILVAVEVTGITDADGNPVEDGDGHPTSAGQLSGGDGRITVNFHGGTVPERIYTVTLSIPDEDADPVSIRINVTDFACGCINVTLDFDGWIPESALHDIEVVVTSKDYQCDRELSPDRPLDEDFWVASRLASGLYEPVRFDCIPAGTYYSVFARAKAHTGECTAAWACNRTLVLMHDTCDDMILDLAEIGFRPAGKYKAIDHFDFSELVEECAGGDTTILECATSAGDVAKTVCCAIAELDKFFNRPQETIVDTIGDVAAQFLGSLIVDTFMNIFRDAVEKVLENYFKNDAPEWLQDFFTIGSDTVGIVSNLTLHSDLLLSKLQNDQTVQGTHYWTGITLYWKLDCTPCHYECAANDQTCLDEEAVCEAEYEACGAIDLDMEDLNNTEFPLDIIEGNFRASVVNFDKLLLERHEIDISYGKLVLFALNEIVIPTVTGGEAHSIKEVAHLWLDCKVISEGIIGEIAGWFGGSEQDVEDACWAGVDSLVGVVEPFIDGLTLDSTLSLTGSATIVDEDCDLGIDHIKNGIYEGNIEGGSQQAPITGTFEAVRADW